MPATLNGLEWEADPLDWIDQQVIQNGTYEPEISRRLVDLLPDGGCFWDVGANAGIHALTVKARRPDVQVMAFEPSPTEFVRLSRNAAANGLGVAAYCIALAERRGYQQLSVVDTGNSGHNSLRPWNGVSYSRTFPVWCDTADDLIDDGVRAPDVMKIDVEGAEPSVLAGARRLLATGRRDLIFEAPEGEPTAVLVLREAGYAVHPVDFGNWQASR